MTYIKTNQILSFNNYEETFKELLNINPACVFLHIVNAGILEGKQLFTHCKLQLNIKPQTINSLLSMVDHNNYELKYWIATIGDKIVIENKIPIKVINYKGEEKKLIIKKLY